MHDMVRLAEPFIQPAGQNQPAVYLGYYFNLGFAVELYLKAFVKHATGDDVAKHRHDLNSILQEALSHGFDFEKSKMKEIVEIIGAEHKGLKFRYAEGASTFSYINQRNLVEIALTACRNGMAHLA
ncbi:hypothetical protein [Acetobacter malorum]|nr:hypothetical protein [Acetobacter malorum]